MTDQTEVQRQEPTAESVVPERRIFMRSLGKWSQAVIAGALLGETLFDPKPAGARDGGGTWANHPGTTQHRTIEEFLMGVTSRARGSVLGLKEVVGALPGWPGRG